MKFSSFNTNEENKPIVCNPIRVESNINIFNRDRFSEFPERKHGRQLIITRERQPKTSFSQKNGIY